MWVKGEYQYNSADVRKVSRDNLSREKQPRLFDRTDWLEKLYEHCLSGYPPLFLRARAEGAEAWLFLYHKKPGEYHALANWYSFTFSPIFSANSEERTRLALLRAIARRRSEEHTSELQSLMRISYAVFCLKKNNNQTLDHTQ